MVHESQNRRRNPILFSLLKHLFFIKVFSVFVVGFPTHNLADDITFSNIFPMKNGCVLVYGGLEFSINRRDCFIQECESSWKLLKTFTSIGHIKKMHFVAADTAWGIIGGGLVKIDFDSDGPIVTIVKRDNHELFLEDLFFVNESIGWACGKNGVVLKTVDGGQSWKELESGTKAHLYKIRFADNNFGWILGKVNDSGEDVDGYLVTKDSGQNWTKVSLPHNGDFSSAYFTSSTHGCGAIRKDALLCTNNGENWDVVKVPYEYSSEIVFIDPRNGWMAGASIMRTTNGGRTWKYSLQHKNKETRKYQGLDLDDVYFVNEQNGWAWGLTSVHKTQNSGKTWDTISDKWLPRLLAEKLTNGNPLKTN